MTKGLEALNRIATTKWCPDYNLKFIWKNEETQKDFETIEKELKALKIIKEKLGPQIVNYNGYIFNKEEYELLKDVLL